MAPASVGSASDDVLTILLKGYVGLLCLSAIVLVTVAFAVNLAPAKVLQAHRTVPFAPRELGWLKLEQRLVLLDFALATLVAAMLPALRPGTGAWRFETFAGLGAVAVLVWRWRLEVVRTTAACLPNQEAARVTLCDYSDSLASTVFLAALLAHTVLAGQSPASSLLLLLLAGVSASISFHALLAHQHITDPMPVENR